MAERIDDIISPKAFEQVQKMNTDISKLVKNFESSANAARLMNAALAGSSSVKTVTESIKGAANEVAKLSILQQVRKYEFAKVLLSMMFGGQLMIQDFSKQGPMKCFTQFVMLLFVKELLTM